MSTKSIIKEKESLKIKEPSKYKVIMHNDDFTPMDFVVFILVNIFKKKEKEAVDIMLRVHNDGSAIVGVYSLDIAKSKVEEAMDLAKQEEYPFKIVVKKV